MSNQEFLNTKYLQLCQQLGDLTLKKEQAESEIEKIKAEIKFLNSAFPLINELELKKMQKDLKNEQS